MVLDPNDADPEKIIPARVPMYDPHELMNWLILTRRVTISSEEIEWHGEPYIYIQWFRV